MAVRSDTNERIPRREPPDFEQSEESVIGGVMEGGLLNVALNDQNQYGPHAMIILLFAVASLTAFFLLLPNLF
tara:strand:- start:84 stop:302 length:219 start_codon:yes stop_codon:yes gene_type:complete